MVLFVCSVEGCEARDERLIAAKQTSSSSLLYFDGDDLPEGWGRYRLQRVVCKSGDRTHTYCPDHAEPSYTGK